MQESTSARVVAQHRGAYTVVTQDGDELRATLAGSLRHAGTHAVVGDRVRLHAGVIESVESRHGEVRRGGDEAPLAANVDMAWVVTALGRDVNPRRVERYLTLASAARVDPGVIVNKADLDPDPPLGDALGALRAVAPGIPVLPVSARTGAGADALEAMLGSGTAVLLGSSGAGKSTLTNRLLGDERQATGATRAADEKGRHTTTRRELVILPGGGALIDTPGLRAVPLTGDAGAAAGAFPEVDELARACRFADCTHTSEPGCAVRGAVAPDRLEAYLALGREARTAAERKRAGRIATRALKQMYDDRGRR